MDAPSTWLCPTELDRERLLDMDRRLKPVRTATFAAIFAALLVTGSTVGWIALAPFAAAVIVFTLADRRIEQRARPEYWAAFAWVFAQLMIGAGIALTGGPDSPAVAWLAIPAVTLGARFRGRGLAVGALLTTLIMAGVLIGTDTLSIAAAPAKLLFPLVLLASVVVLSTALMSSDIAHRSEAVLDPLTGLLNRSALSQRYEELAQQARLTGESVGVIVGDLDHFKSINDEYGHAQGDAVLREVAYTMRKSMRAFDLIYRLGGEEFMILLPGANLHHAHMVAERLRRAVQDARPAGLDVSMSLGASAAMGGKLSYERIFEVADAALYEAKRQGRNRVNARAPESAAETSAPVLA